MAIKLKNHMRALLIWGGFVLVLIATMVLCSSMVRTIDQRMNESATSNLLSATRVIHDTLESTLDKDMDALAVIGDFFENDESMRSEQVDVIREAMNLDWVAIVDAQGDGVGCFSGVFQASDLPCYEEWTPGEAGYSDAYIGTSGRPQIALWKPIYRNDVYWGTVFGGTILTKYYSSNVFTFYEGEGRTYLFDGTDGSWILKSLGADGVDTLETDIYSLLSASGNNTQDIEAFRQAVEERKAGTAQFRFNDEQSYLCFLPLQSSPDWYVTTVIAKSTLLRESAEVQRMIRWMLLILFVTLAAVASAFALWRVRKARTEEARYRETLFANISANLDSAFLIYDRAGKKVAFVSDNFMRLLGLDRTWLAEDAERLFDWCAVPQDDPQRTAFLDGALSTPAVREVCVKNELGQNDRTVRMELIPAGLGQELAVLTDITKDKEIQTSLIEAMQRAEAASNAKNDFLSSMSHDLRTPINGVVGMTAIAAAHLDDKRRVKDCLQKISESTAQLLSLINEVLDMSQIESGRVELVNEPFNVAELLQNVLNVNYPGIQQKNHTVKVHIHLMEHEKVIGDPARLTRIATNLISNAIKYTPPGGSITLTLQEKSPVIHGFGCYELTVSDNGIGMSKAFQERIFTPFEREDDVRISRIQGTGLGMSIVKSLVELMMGSIHVESEKGKGSTFRVIFNLRLDEQDASRDNTRLAGLPVLVVDDDISACETVVETLDSIGMEGEWTNSGRRAVDMAVQRHARNADYMAILLDWKMPEMDGVETARRIRAELGTELPIIILTAYDWGEIEAEARAAGVDAFLTKPIYKAKLLQKMTEVFEGHVENGELPISGGSIPPGKRVLLAEDNELNREIAVELLHMVGVQVDCADDGAAAVEVFATSAPDTYDMILMDIQMPKMNGYEATRAIRRLDHPDCQTIPIVAMTADAFKKDKQAAREAGMDEHLAKPISVERLTQMLTRFLNRRDAGK